MAFPAFPWAAIKAGGAAGSSLTAIFVIHHVAQRRWTEHADHRMITYDPAKRAITRKERNLDFEDAAEVFAGETFSFVDDRNDYGEVRIVTVGLLDGRMIVVGWTPRGDDQHVFSMRKANAREQTKYRERLGKGGSSRDPAARIR